MFLNTDSDADFIRYSDMDIKEDTSPPFLKDRICSNSRADHIFHKGFANTVGFGFRNRFLKGIKYKYCSTCFESFLLECYMFERVLYLICFRVLYPLL